MKTTAKNMTKTQERRSASRDLIKKLTAERAEVLALYCRVAGLEPYERQKTDKPISSLIQEFCQLLMDYIAAGHFSLYERIVNGKERRRAPAELAEKLYPRIAETTDIALAFNDKYDTEEHSRDISGLEQDMSRLGQALAARAELEDKLLQALL